jgi:hypothetical protein
MQMIKRQKHAVNMTRLKNSGLEGAQQWNVRDLKQEKGRKVELISEDPRDRLSRRVNGGQRVAGSRPSFLPPFRHLG